jgi:hypothetical protein
VPIAGPDLAPALILILAVTTWLLVSVIDHLFYHCCQPRKASFHVLLGETRKRAEPATHMMLNSAPYLVVDHQSHPSGRTADQNGARLYIFSAANMELSTRTPRLYRELSTTTTPSATGSGYATSCEGHMGFLVAIPSPQKPWVLAFSRSMHEVSPCPRSEIYGLSRAKQLSGTFPAPGGRHYYVHYLYDLGLNAYCW